MGYLSQNSKFARNCINCAAMNSDYKAGSESSHPIQSNPWTDPIHVPLCVVVAWGGLTVAQEVGIAVRPSAPEDRRGSSVAGRVVGQPAAARTRFRRRGSDS